MAQRPVFVVERLGRVSEVVVDFQWYPGMSKSQKQRSVDALHEAAASRGIDPLLEVSTKSEEPLGVSLSALILKASYRDMDAMSVECAFQGSKAFEKGGPFTDLYCQDSIVAKRDKRLRESGALLNFNLAGDTWPLEPKTAFYDWLYLQALLQNETLSDRLDEYAGFTDIEFNPKKSFSTQARTCALFVALRSKQVNVSSLVEDREQFMNELAESYGHGSARQPSLFSFGLDLES